MDRDFFNSAQSASYSYDSQLKQRLQDQMNQQQRDFNNQVFQQQENAKRNRALDVLTTKIENQNITHQQMISVISELVSRQNESNKIIEKQCEALLEQNKLLKEQNEKQAVDLKKQRKYNLWTYGITTLIALSSVVASFISLF